jgi:aerobic-type carbon monoxide dehydrogenase small subunit (CoxS/CutS family)
MQLNLTINNEPKPWNVAPNETLLHVLRANGYFGVKHGCENGECGACAVLIDGAPVTGRELRALLTLDIHTWPPAECPLCRQGSAALRPKAHWQELTR